MLATVPATTRMVNRALRNSDRSTSGQRTLFSTMTNAASTATEATNAMMVPGVTQPQLGARSNVNVNKPIPTVINASPDKSMRRGTVSSELAGTVSAAITNDTKEIGTNNQKIHRQPSVWVSRPPTNGPAALPSPAIPYANPIAWPARTAGNALVSTADRDREDQCGSDSLQSAERDHQSGRRRHRAQRRCHAEQRDAGKQRPIGGRTCRRSGPPGP